MYKVPQVLLTTQLLAADPELYERLRMLHQVFFYSWAAAFFMSSVRACFKDNEGVAGCVGFVNLIAYSFTYYYSWMLLFYEGPKNRDEILADGWVKKLVFINLWCTIVGGPLMILSICCAAAK